MKKLLVIGFVGLLSISACGNESPVEAGTPSGFTEVTRDELADTVTVIKHNETACYYVSTKGVRATAITQMFVEKNGVSVPYCD